MKMLHPFMPFVTEEIYGAFHNEEPLCIASWPQEIKEISTESEDEVKQLISLIKTIREIKLDVQMKPSAPINIMVQDLEGNPTNLHENTLSILERMVKATLINLEGDLMTRPIYNGSLSVKMSEIVNKEEEIAKLSKEKDRLEKEISRGEGMLKNEKFISKAPAAKVEEEKKKLEGYKSQYKIVCDKLEELNK